MATQAVRRKKFWLRSRAEYLSGAYRTAPSCRCLSQLTSCCYWRKHLDRADAKSYCPISILSVISKLLERLSSFSDISRTVIYFQIFSWRTEHTTQQRQQFWGSCRIYCRHWIPATLRYWHFGLVGSIWQRRPSHAPPVATKVIWSKHKGHRLVYFLSQQLITTSSHYDVHFDAVGSSLWSTTRLGPWTDLVSSVYCRHAAARQMPSSQASCICRRYPDLWTLSAVWYWQAHAAGIRQHWWGFSMDESN